MKVKYLIVFLFFCLCNTISAQFGYRVLKKKQTSKTFVPQRYISADNKEGVGFGKPDPTSVDSIIFSESQPKGEETENWKVIEVHYVEFYAPPKSRRDTLKMYYLTNKKGVKRKGMEQFLYANSKARLYKSIDWPGYWAPHNLIFFQTTELPILESTTLFLNYNNPKAFVRSAKRIFKKCNAMIQKVENGNYYPKNVSNVKTLADDYESLCHSK